jgi:hypothetical protein
VDERHSGRAFVDHWTWAVKRGLMNSNTAGALRAACTSVLEVEDGWESMDVTKMDIDVFVKRFSNLKAKDYTTDSLKEYDRRFRKAHGLYLAFLQDPTTWDPGGRRPSANGGKKEKDAVREVRAEGNGGAATPKIPSTPGFVEYPFPLRDNRIAKLILPIDLKATEAKRLSAFVATLALDSEAEA